MTNIHKTYLLLAICTLIIYTQQQLKDPAFMATYAKYQTECAKEVGIELDYVKTLWKDNRFPNDNKLKCYFKCTSIKLGILSEAGDVLADTLKKIEIEWSDEATDREVVEECGGIKGADPCDTAFKLLACIKAAELD